MEHVDVFVNGFELNEQERADLVSFLYALTDESQLPEIPTAVPSGLPVVARVANPVRDLVAEQNSGTSGGQTAASREPMTIVVQAGETIQAAVDRAQPGDTIEIPYGVYPVQSTNVLVERVTVTGVDDAGIYAGQCENVIVRDSTVYGNVLGIELENTLGGEIYNNHAYDNTLGILIILLPQLTSKISSGARIYNNVIEANNHENSAPEGATARIAPPGTGILIVASDNNEVYDNKIRDNKTAGLAVFSLTGTGTFDEDEIDVGPLPEGNYAYNNTYANNGYDPDPVVSDLGIPAGDILWDTSGANNRFDEPGATGGFPPLLPGNSWPSFLQRAYGNLLNFVIGLVA